MATQTFWQEMSAEVSRDRRREQRVALVFPIEVCGLDQEERFFAERCVTSSVSLSGCRFHLSAALVPGTIIAVKLLNRETGYPYRNQPLLFQIAWASKNGEGWTAGAHALQKENLWGIAFPEALVESFPHA
ncbi:MAG: PilZ domain-containing protein [Acidobacteria bacterium]|nr:PilZ domain-containing protein [Acidobacteriota bacterium]